MNGEWRMESWEFLLCRLYDAGAVVGGNDAAAVEVAAAVGDVQLIALAEAEDTHGMAALLGIEGAEGIGGYIFTIE